jgi:YfiR/HmsC-like
MGLLSGALRLAACGALMLVAAAATDSLAADAPTEDQVKAVFLFNFAHFVDWPVQPASSDDSPFVIGVVGGEELGARLQEATRGERIGDHPLLVARYRHVEDIGDCRILYIERSESAMLNRVLAALGQRATLTVSDIAGSAEHGVMIQFVTDNNRIRLRINVDSARAAGLTLSSKLLRPAEIVNPATGE